MTFSRYAFPPAGGARIGLRALDARASAFLERFARAAGWPRVETLRGTPSIRISVSPLKTSSAGDRTCRLAPLDSASEFYCHAVDLTMTIGREIQKRGGVFLHGALAEFRGRGVVLAAPGGTGKTTASGRLPRPWHSLCDDMSLLVPGRAGIIQAQPWPTLSRFLDGGPGGTWNTSRAVPLAAIYFLLQAAGERVDRVGPGEGLSLLVESSEQASHAMSRGLSLEERRILRRERFENLAAIARAVPVHLLRLSVKGAFWKEIERTFAEKPRRF